MPFPIHHHEQNPAVFRFSNIGVLGVAIQIRTDPSNDRQRISCGIFCLTAIYLVFRYVAFVVVVPLELVSVLH